MVEKYNRIDSLLDRVDASLAGGRRWIVLLFVLVFILKLIYIFCSSNSLEIRIPILDAEYYDNMGRHIAAGHLAQKEAFFMGPLYPYFLGLVYRVFGGNMMLLRIIQILGGTTTVVLTYFIGKRVFRPSVAMLGAVMLTLYGTITFYEGQLLMEWLGALINMMLLFVLYQDFGRHRVLKYIVTGFLLGLSALTRANILIFAPIVLIWVLFVAKEKKRFLSAAVFIVSALVTISPATIHNYVVSRDFVLITWNGSMNFFIGNNEKATGVYDSPRGIDLASDWTTRRYVEKMAGRDLKPSEISSYWLSETGRFIKEHPRKELALLFRKTALFLNAFELPQTESHDLSRSRYAILRVLFVNFWILCSLGLVGMMYSLREWRRCFLLHWFIISCSVSIILFFITARYRIQIVPPLALFAAFTVVEILPRSFAHLSRGFQPLAIIAILFFLTRPGLFAPDLDHIRWREYIHEGRRWAVLGETDRALAEIDKAVALRPDDPESYIHRAIIYKDSGRLPQAIEDYHRSLGINPAMPAIHYDLAQVLRRARMYSAAVEEYMRAIAQDSLMVEAYNNLGITYQLMKNYDGAIQYFMWATRIDPEHVKAYNNLGVALAESGDVDGAIRCFGEAIERDPAYANSYKNLAMAYAAKNQLLEAKMNLEQYIKLVPDDAAAAAALQEVSVAIEADTVRSGLRR